jgi:WD40 repeat protein
MATAAPHGPSRDVITGPRDTADSRETAGAVRRWAAAQAASAASAASAALAIGRNGADGRTGDTLGPDGPCQPEAVTLSAFTRVGSWRTGNGRINTVAWAPPSDGGLRLAMAGESQATDIWDADSGQRIQALTNRAQPAGIDDTHIAVKAAWGHDRAGRVLLATGAVDGAARIWDPGTGELLHTLTGHSNAASVAWGTTADGQPTLATVDWAGATRIWDPDTGAQLSAFPGRDHGSVLGRRQFGCIAWGTGTGGQSLLAASRNFDGLLRIWDASGEQPRETSSPGRPVHTGSIAYGQRADGRLVLATAEEAVHLWTQEDGELRDDSLPQPSGDARVVCWSPLFDGRLLLAVSTRTAVHLWDGHSLSHLHSEPLDLSATGNDCLDWILTPDGHLLLATASSHDQVDIWEAVLDPPVRQHPSAAPATARMTGQPRPAPDRPPAPVVISSVTELQVLGSGNRHPAVTMGRQEDGRLVVVTADEDNNVVVVRVWDPFTGQLLQSLPGHQRTVYSAAWGYRRDGGPLLATASFDGTTRVWDASTWQPLAVIRAEGTDTRYHCAWGRGPDGQALLAANVGSGEIQILDPDSGALSQTLTATVDPAPDFAWTRLRGGQEILAILDRGTPTTVRLVDPGSGRQLGSVTTEGPAWAIALNEQPDGQLVIATTRDGPAGLQMVPVDDLAETGFPYESLPSGASASYGVTWAPLNDGRALLAVTGTDGLTLWDARTRRCLHTGPPNFGTRGWYHVAWGLTTDGRLLLAATSTDGCHIWEVTLDPPATPPEDRSPAGSRGHPGRPRAARGELVLPPREVTPEPPAEANAVELHKIAAAVSPNGRVLLAASGNPDSAGLWDLEDGRHIRTLTGHTGMIDELAWARMPDGRLLLATGSRDSTARIWDPETGQTLQTLTGHTGNVHSVAWGPQPDGSVLLATGSSDDTARIWDPETGQSLQTLTGHTSTVFAVAWGTAPDGAPLIATTSADHTARIWDPQTGQLLHTLTGHTHHVDSVAWGTLSDGTPLVATASSDQTARIWDPQTGQLLHTLTGHSGSVWSVAFAQTLDGRLLLATASGDRTVRIWDPESGAELASLPGADSHWRPIAWTRDRSGNLLLAVVKPQKGTPPFRAWLVEAAITGVGTAEEAGALAEQVSGSLLRLGGGGLWLPLGLLADLVALTGSEGASESLPLHDPKLAALAAEPGIARLRALATGAPHWNEAARAAFAAMLTSSLDIPGQYAPPPEAEPGALRDALAMALGRPPGQLSPWQAAAGELRDSAHAITDQAVALLAILGPQACANDPLLPVRLARHIPRLPALSPRELRLLTLAGSRTPASGAATAGTMAYSPGTAGFARNGPLTRLLPTQLALPRDLMTIRLAEDQLLFRQHRAPLPPAPEPVTIILDTTPPTFGPAGTALRLAAHLLTVELWEHGRYPALVTLTDPGTVSEPRSPTDLIKIWTSATLNDPAAAIAMARQTAAGLGQPTVLCTHHQTARDAGYRPGPASRLLTAHQPPEEARTDPSGRWHRHLPPNPDGAQLASVVAGLLEPGAGDGG